MKRFSLSPPGLFLALAASILISACSPQTKSLEPAEPVAQRPIEAIALMPVADLRPDRFGFIDVGRDVGRAARKLLPGKGYSLLVRGERRLVPDPGAEGVEALMFIAVENLEMENGELGRTFKVRLSAVLLEPDSGDVLWRDSAVGRSSLVGLMALLARPSSQYEAVYEALDELFSTLPGVDA